MNLQERQITTEDRPKRREWMIVLAIFVAALVWRALTVGPISIGGDAIHKWGSIRNLVTDGIVPQWDHHTMRWGINLPVLAIQALFGTHPALYYVFPIFCGALLALMVYLVGRELHSWTVGLIAAVAVSVHTPLHYLASDFLPDLPRALYLMSCLYLLLRWRKTRKSKFVFLAGAALFLAYGAKVTALYYGPPAVFFIAMESNGWSVREFHRIRAVRKNLAAFCLPLVAGLVVETLGVYLLTGHPTGRLLTGTAHHFATLARYSERGGLAESGVGRETFWGWVTTFTEYRDLCVREQAILLVGVLCSVCVLVARLRRVRLLGLWFLAGMSLQTWMVTSINPWLFPQQHLLRFQSFLFVQSIILLVVVGAMLCTRFRLTTRKWGWIVALVPAGMFILALMPHTRLQIWKETSITDNPIRRAAMDVELVSQARQHKIPIAMEAPVVRTERDTVVLSYLSRKTPRWFTALFGHDYIASDSRLLARLLEKGRILHDVESGRALFFVERGQDANCLLVGTAGRNKTFRYEHFEAKSCVPVEGLKIEGMGWEFQRREMTTRSRQKFIRAPFEM